MSEAIHLTRRSSREAADFRRRCYDAAQLIVDICDRRSRAKPEKAIEITRGSFDTYSLIAPVFNQAMAILVDHFYAKEVSIGVWHYGPPDEFEGDLP